ncbi:hypothetical protein INR49_027488 [Caranx melampygus]|nr:hypothetical protein INR49_027488 [Caranx melampygus]
MKNTGPSVESPPAAPVRTTPTVPVASQDAGSLVNLLSKVDVSPADLLSALSKVQGQGSLEGITSILSSPAANAPSASATTGKIPPSSSFTSASVVPSQSPPLSSAAPVPSSHSSTVRQSTNSQAPPQTSKPASALVQALHTDMDLTTEPEKPSSSSSLESKIHSFLQGNPAFSAFDLGFNSTPAGGEIVSPVTGTDNQDGTPVRDEGGGTPTQDEIMDGPVPFTSNTNQSSLGQTAPSAYQNSTQNLSSSQQQVHLQPGVALNGQVYQPQSNHGIPAPVGHYQQMSAQTGGMVPGERAPGLASGTQTLEGFQGGKERGWYGDTYPEGSSQQPRGYSATMPGENTTPGLYPYQTEQAREHQDLPPQQGGTTSSGFFRSNLPPVPKLPPPPRSFDAPPPVASSAMIPPEQQPVNLAGEGPGGRVSSAISGMVVHDHQHKSMFHSDDPLYELDRPRLRPPEGLHPHPDDLRYHEDLERYHDELRRREGPLFQDDAYHHPDDPYYRPGSPPHQYLRHRGITPPLSPSEDPYYARDYQRHSPPPPHYGPRRPLPPPHPEMHHPGPRPPHHPIHPARHLPPRGPPHAPFPPFQGPNPRLRGKRPGPRGGGNTGPMFPPKRPFPPPRF